MVWSSIWGKKGIEFAKRIIGRKYILNCQEIRVAQQRCSSTGDTQMCCFSRRGQFRTQPTIQCNFKKRTRLNPPILTDTQMSWYTLVLANFGFFFPFWTNLPSVRGRVWSLCEHDGVALWGVSMVVKGNQSIGHCMVPHSRVVVTCHYCTATSGKVIQV